MPTTASVDVVTQACQSDLDTAAERDALGLPRFSGDEGDTQQLNIMAQQLEAVVNEKALQNSVCDICPTNGAVILNCQECGDFRVMATEDINSITMLNCDKSDGTIDILVPPNTTRCICGWPETFGFEGGECFTLCVSGGTNPAGRTFSVPYTGTRGGAQVGGMPGAGVPTTGGGGGGGGGGCACTPSTPGTLTVVCCTAGCTMDCTATNPSIVLRSCDGVPPYSWSASASSVVLEVGGEDSEQCTATPVVNSGSAVAGNAFESIYCANQPAACLVSGTIIYTGNCNNVVTCVSQFTGTCCPGVNPCVGAQIPCADLTTVCAACNTNPPAVGGGYFADCRTAQMITDGCQPCGLIKGVVITVTDSTGVTATKTLAVTVALP